jgi:hypothetical protein
MSFFAPTNFVNYRPFFYLAVVVSGLSLTTKIVEFRRDAPNVAAGGHLINSKANVKAAVSPRDVFAVEMVQCVFHL